MLRRDDVRFEEAEDYPGRERWMRRDWIRAGMVGSGASRVGGWPRSRRVWEVMGPMEARVMVGGRVRLAASRRAMRLRAMEALVKVMASR